jgi:hypothetical protein
MDRIKILLDNKKRTSMIIMEERNNTVLKAKMAMKEDL